MKEIILILFVIALLSGVIHSIVYSSLLDYYGTVIIATIYGLGFAGLMTMYESVRQKDERKRWLMLFVGFMSILIAWLTLETLSAKH